MREEVIRLLEKAIYELTQAEEVATASCKYYEDVVSHISNAHSAIATVIRKLVNGEKK